MRLAGWAFVMCCVLGIVGLFAPAVGVGQANVITRYASISLYTAGTKREVTQRVFAAYHRAPGKGLGHAIAGALIPRAGKRLGGVLDDLDSAAVELDEVSDADVGLAGKALVGIVWVLLVGNVLAGLVIAAEAMASHPPRRKRIAIGVGLALVLAALSIAVYLVCREVAWQANDELGKQVLAVRAGGYLVLVGGVGALVAGVAFLLGQRRSA